jgi:hypothetical protein
MRRGALEIFTLLAKNHQVDHLERNLETPCPFDSEEARSGMQAAPAPIANIMALLAELPALRRLFERYLFTALLLCPDRDAARRCSSSWPDNWFGDSFAPKTRAAMLEGEWRSVPVAMVREVGPPCTCAFLVGLVPRVSETDPWPIWAGSLMDDCSRQAVKTAVKVAGAHSRKEAGRYLFTFPLLADCGCARIHGASLGLPLALGFYELLEGQSATPPIRASGALAGDGKVSAVSGLDAKTTVFGEDSPHACSLFLVPGGSNYSAPKGGAEVVEVASFDDALLCRALYQPGNARSVQRVIDALKSGTGFATACADLPAGLLNQAMRGGWTDRARKEILASRDLLGAVAYGLAKRIERFDHAGCDALGRVLGPALPKGTQTIAPLASYRWATLHIALANHRGRVEESRRWKERAGRLDPLIRRAYLEDWVACQNHLFIGSRHNHYRFDPALPEPIEEALTVLEKIQHCRQAAGCTVNPPLAALYGSIAQNYAFCGPGHLEQTLDYTHRAMAAFGEMQVPELAGECRRQRCYRAFALLDAGDPANAEGELRSYIAVADWRSLPHRRRDLNPFQHAALARFFALTPGHAAAAPYLRHFSKGEAATHPPMHPWQLWCWNLGRTAAALGRPGEARAHFAESLRRCGNPELGAAVNVMALLPLAGLKALGGALPEGAGTVEKGVRKAAIMLDREHFKPLEQIPFPELLDRLWERPAMLFPFTYH